MSRSETDILRSAAEWALSGRTGLSAESIAQHMLGFQCRGNYPHDDGDFGRCELLLDAIPEFRTRLPEMANVNAYWAALVPIWNDIKGASMSIRYKMIQDAVRPIEDEDPRIIIRFGGGR